MKITKAATVTTIAGLAIELSACGSTTTHVKTVTVPATTAQTTQAAYYGPPCSTMDSRDSDGYSMCNPHGKPCPDGWAASNSEPACVPVATSEPPPPSGADAPSTTTSTANDLSGPVGMPFTDTDDQNNKMEVTLTQIIDPAKPANEFGTPDNGNRFVGAKFSIKGISGEFSDDANTDAVLIGSDGQTYQPDFNDIAGCTNFNAGSYSVSPGQTTIGCVVFQVPERVQVQSIQWGGGFGATPATWTVR